MESNLTPYQAEVHVLAKHALVLAPHADDEVFGCGGSILSHVAHGIPVSVVILTDGGRFGDPLCRMAESRDAACVLGYGEPEFWSLSDRLLHQQQDLVERVLQKINDVGADLVYAPSPWEIHPDHRRTASAAIEAVCKAGIRIAFYEVGCPLTPNLLLDITKFVETKAKAMLCFPSQLQQQRYDRHISALNEYRTYTLPAVIKAAEAYLLCTSSELTTLLPGLLAARNVTFGINPLAHELPPDLPLVSVVICSMDTIYLQEALDSVSLQIFPHIEVLVIAENPQHQLLSARCGPFSLRLIPTELPLSRSQAANKGLSEARGEFFLVLHDVDWLMPEHIAKLVQILRQKPSSLAAYSGVAFIGTQGEPLGQVKNILSDEVHHLAGNLTLIHAVLFSQKLLAGGCQFDETLLHHEDWDFCLQVSLKTLFLHAPGISSVHRIQKNQNVQFDVYLTDLANQKINNKWADYWLDGRASQLMKNDWQVPDFDVQLLKHNKYVDQTTKIINEQTLLIQQQEAKMSVLLNSSSWKVTSIFRWISAKLKA